MKKNRIKPIRLGIAGMSQRELADEIGVSVSTIHRWENGEPPDYRLPQIADALGVHVEDLTGEAEFSMDERESDSREWQRADLRGCRLEAGMGVKNVADEIGVEPDEYRHWELTQSAPRSKIEQIANIFGIEVGELETSPEERIGPERAESQWGKAYKEEYRRNVSRLNTWRDAVISNAEDILPEEASERERNVVLLALLAMPMEPFWDLGLSSFTLEELCRHAHVPDEVVRKWWPEILESDYVKRVGRGEWVVQLTFPEEQNE